MTKYAFFLIGAFILLAACQGKIDRPDSILTQEQKDRINAQTVSTPATGSVLHYSCPNGHNQGGDAAGTCSECGAEFVHNTAFHNQASSGTATPGTSTNTNTPPSGVQHYICPNGHSQGGAAAGTCTECGAEFTHNQAFHANTGVPATPNPSSVTVPPATTTSPEPAQNTAGIWHYTCPNGHAGGAGGASPCGECGTTLAHNPAYHN